MIEIRTQQMASRTLTTIKVHTIQSILELKNLWNKTSLFFLLIWAYIWIKTWERLRKFEVYFIELLTQSDFEI